jgi:hypothetical protein
VAYYRDTEQGSAYAETTAYAAYAPLDRHIHVRSSNRKISVGEYVVFHVKSNFALLYFDWIIVRCDSNPRTLFFLIEKLPPYALMGFDRTAHSSAKRDSASTYVDYAGRALIQSS